MEPSRYFIRRGGNVPMDAPIEAEASPVFLDEGQPLIDLHAYWRIVRKHYRLIIAITAAVVMLTMVRVMTERPTYYAETTIMIQPAAEGGGSDTLENLIQIEAAASNSDLYYKTQCEILESRALAASVIKTLGLERNPAFVGAQAKPGFIDRLFSRIARSLHLTGGKAGPRLVLPPGLDNTQGVPAYLVHAYLGALQVEPVQDTNLIRIRFDWSDPVLTAQVANAHVAAYSSNQIEMHGQESSEAESFLQGKLVDLKDKLEKSEVALNDYRRKNRIVPGLVSLDGKDAIVLDRLADLSKDLTQAQVARIGLQAQAELIKRHNYSGLAAVIDDPEIQDDQKALGALYAQQAALASQFKPTYPPLAKLDAQIREVQGQIGAATNKKVVALQSSYDEAVEREKELGDEMEKQRQETLALNDLGAQYAILQRDVDTNRELYNAVLTRMKDVEVARDIQSTNVSIVNPAEVPEGPSGPKKMLALMLASVVGLGVGLGVAFGIEFLDNTLKNPEEAENYLHLPNLGVVPEFSSVNGKTAYAPPLLPGDATPSTVLPPGRELVTTHGSYSRVGEAYRNLRTALLLSRAGGPPKVMLITSALSREGKTVTAVNIAVMLAQLGGKVVLIDADLRRARCHRVLAVDNHLGLTEVLTGSRELTEMIRPTEIENLFFLSSGSVPPNPTELLVSPKMAETVAELRDNYEYVVIDSAPVLPVSDSMVLSRLTDGVVIVANGSATPRQQVKTACARLEYARAKILGVVLNRIKLHSPDYHSYYHQEYYAFESDDRRDDEDAV